MKQRLKDLHRKLLRLHKILLDDERREYEKVHGAVETSGKMLNLAMFDPWFHWLHGISRSIVEIDQILEDENSRAELAMDLIMRLRVLFHTGADDEAFGKRYRAVLQRDAAAVLAHADVQQLLALDS